MLILLDIDGVMVPANAWKKPEFLDDGFPAFSVKSIHALQKIVAETGATVMLTTSHKSRYNNSQWREIFQVRGIDVRIRRLKSNSLKTNRKDEILNWFTTSTNLKDGFVIIDDDKLLNALPKSIKENLVLTSPSVGLTDELAHHAISILKQGVHSYASIN